MTPDKKKALTKIAKCLELGNSTNINEAAQAIRMAQRLMLKYGLDQDDLHYINLGQTTAEHLLPSQIDNNIIKLLRNINARFGVECVLVNHKGLKKAEFIGDASHAIFAAFAFDVIYREMNEQIGFFKNRLSQTRKLTPMMLRRIDIFSQGWLEGAIDQLPQLTTSNSQLNNIQQYIDREFENIDRETFKKQLKEAMGQLTDDYEVGMKKGKKIKINRPIANTDKHKTSKLIKNNM